MGPIGKPVCGKGHERPVGANCQQCCRDRALARYYAKREEINVVRNEKRRGAYPPRQKEYDADGNPLCAKGHVRKPNVPCQLCRVDSLREKAGGLCRKGHPWDGVGRQCPICYRESRAAWYAAHAQQQREHGLRKYYALKTQGINPNDYERVKKWRSDNPEKRLEYDRLYRQRHSEQERSRVERWRIENPERVREIGRNAANRRHARKKGALGSHTEAEWQAIVARQRGLCVACGLKKKLTKDHIVPLSRGGCDYAWNIAGMCKPCNSRKRANLPIGTQLSLYDRVVEIVHRE